MSYDRWLESPYQDMMEESDRFYDWAEKNGFEDAESEEAEKAYMDWLEAQYEDAAEARAEALAEAYLDRMEYEAHEVDNYFEEY